MSPNRSISRARNAEALGLIRISATTTPRMTK
jgi:hypothetical protein